MAIAPHIADIGNARNMPKSKYAKYFKSEIVSLNIDQTFDKKCYRSSSLSLVLTAKKFPRQMKWRQDRRRATTPNIADMGNAIKTLNVKISKSSKQKAKLGFLSSTQPNVES